MTTKKIAAMTAEERYKKRMDDAYDALQAIAKRKTPPGRVTTVYHKVASNLGVTGATVFNYLNGKEGTRRRGNGYFIEALIEQFEQLPDVEEYS